MELVLSAGRLHLQINGVFVDSKQINFSFPIKGQVDHDEKQAFIDMCVVHLRYGEIQEIA